MIAIPHIKDFFDYVKKTYTDDVVDRLCYFYTTLILTVMAIGTGSKQIFGQPIECIMPPEFSEPWVNYVRQYCYITSTYYVPPQMSWSESERESYVIQGYYQWVPVILFLQALTIYLPHVLWVTVQCNLPINYEHVVQQATALHLEFSEDRQNGINDIVSYIKHRLSYQGSNYTNLHNFHKKVSTVGFGSKSTFFHMSSKILTVIIIYLQLLFMNMYFGRGKTNFWGLWLTYNSFNNVYWEETGAFPRVTFCDFNMPSLGANNRRTVQCVLMLNMLNEMLFAFNWLWLAFLLIVCVGNLFYCMIIYYTPYFRRSVAQKYLRPLPESLAFTVAFKPIDITEVRSFADETLGADGVHLIRFIARHAGSLVATQICHTLYASLHTPKPEVVPTHNDDHNEVHIEMNNDPAKADVSTIQHGTPAIETDIFNTEFFFFGDVEDNKAGNDGNNMSCGENKGQNVDESLFKADSHNRKNAHGRNKSDNFIRKGYGM